MSYLTGHDSIDESNRKENDQPDAAHTIQEKVALAAKQHGFSVAQTMPLNKLAAVVHKANEKWWVDLETGAPIGRNTGEMLMLVVSEIAEAMEADRKMLNDDHLPHRRGFDVEIVDAIIRLLDLAAAKHIDLDTVFMEKMAYNAQRLDHTREHRLGEHGKKY